MPPSPPDVTQLLLLWSDGDDDALEQLVPLVYDELRRLAHHHLWHERPGHTLGTTGLVHEAYFNLIRQDGTPWQSRAHFFAVAARVMRHVLIDHARRRGRIKRGGNLHRRTLDDEAAATEAHYDELLTIDQALTRLESFDARASRIVECRYFGGLSVQETADVLAISPATVKRDWAMARAWLRREIMDGQAGPGEKS